jgi:hypothetical protein
MKLIISKQDKVKRLVLLQHNTLVPEEEDQKTLQKFTKMNPSNTGHGRQSPSVNSKKKPDSEEEDKEEDEEEEDKEEEDDEEEKEIATALDSKEVSHVHVGMDASDHSKQRLESEIAPETQNDPEPDRWL